MKGSLKIIITIAIIVIIGVLYFDFKYDNTPKLEEDSQSDTSSDNSFFTLISDNSTVSKSDEKGNDTKSSSTQPQIEYEPDYTNENISEIGWIPSWDYSRGLETANSIASRLNTVSPVWFSVNKDGSLNDTQPANIQAIEKLRSDNNILLIPTISMFDSATIKSILQDQDNYNRHLNEIVGYVISRNYDGIDLDYEMIELTEKEKFLNFVEALSTELRQSGKKLSITVLAKWDTLIYPSLNETRNVQDWKILGGYADQFRIMTYDFHGPTSEAGPIGPLDWQTSVLERAIEEVDRRKVWLGVNLYGYQWSTDGSVVALTYRQIEEIFDENTVETEYNKAYGEGMAQYQCGDFECTIYYQTPEGIADRKALAKRFGIAGLTYWRLGDENNLLK